MFDFLSFTFSNFYFCIVFENRTKIISNNQPSFNEIENAAAFFIFNRVTFSGTTESGGYSEQACQGRFTDSSIERLKPFGQVLQNTQITNLDYQHLVDTEGDDVFIFLDPPYYSATKSALYGKRGNLHKVFDHERFAEVMKKCPHKWPPESCLTAILRFLAASV